MATDETSYVLGRICLSTGQYLSDNESCPDKGSPADVDWDSLNGYLLVSNYYSGGVSVVSPATGAVLTTLSGGTGFDGAAVDSADGDIYVPSGYGEGNDVEVYSGTNFALLDTIPVGSNPAAALFDPADGDVYVANAGSNNVTVIDATTNQVVVSVPVGAAFAGEADLTLDPATGNLYVTGEFNSATIVNASSDRVVGSVSLGTYGTGMAFDPENGELYVPNVNEDTLTVINGTTNRVVGNISIYTTYWSSGDDPVTAAFDPSTGNICVTNFFSVDIDVVPGSTNSLMAAIPAAGEGWGIAFDPSNGYGYASSFDNDTVTVFTTPHSYPVTFVETGLPSSVNWTVSTLVPSAWFYSVIKTTDRNSTTIAEPNGTADFSASAANYTATPGRGMVNVTGQPLRIPVRFAAVPVTSSGPSTVAPTAEWYGVGALATILVASVVAALAVRARRKQKGGRRESPNQHDDNSDSPATGGSGQVP